MDPTLNDVLSGRGVSFNRHPGNKNFRMLLQKQTVRRSLGLLFYPPLSSSSCTNSLDVESYEQNAYAAGTKKQKMDISKSIVVAVYSMEPPGRFIKKCDDTGEWIELSMREAANKTSQAMAYVVRERAAKQKNAHVSLSLPQGRGTIDRQHLPSAMPSQVSTSMAQSLSASDRQRNNLSTVVDSVENDQKEQKIWSLPQQLLQMQKSSPTTSTVPLTYSGVPLSGNELAPLLTQTQLLLQQKLHHQQSQQQQQQQQQQQNQHQQLLLLQHLTGLNRSWGLQTQLPLSLSLSAPSLSTQGVLLPNNDILRQAALLQGSHLMGSCQQANLLQNQVQVQSQSSPINGLLSLVGMLLQSQSALSPANQVQQNEQSQVQQPQPLNHLLQQLQAALLQQLNPRNPPNTSSSPNPVVVAATGLSRLQQGSQGAQKGQKGEK
jgi:hypothetical protein